MDTSPPKVCSLRATPVNVPLARPHPTASGVVSSAPLVLIDLETDQGLTAGVNAIIAATKVAYKGTGKTVAETLTASKTESAYDIGYRVGLETYAALGSVRVVEVDRFLNKEAEIMGPYTKKHASESTADEAWIDDFVRGSTQALRDKNLYSKIGVAVVSMRDQAGMQRAMINHFQ